MGVFAMGVWAPGTLHDESDATQDTPTRVEAAACLPELGRPTPASLLLVLLLLHQSFLLLIEN